MREANILQHSLHQYCPELHLKRLNSLMLASKALIECKTLTLTELGRIECKTLTLTELGR
ncbi:hypothetical protein L5M17_20810, partial [Shewanella sp. SW24]|nr:hypothetical protein [Shewanella sp. SW24]